MAKKVGEDSVRLAYRLLLNREPESDEVVRDIAASVSSVEELRSTFTNSPEYRTKNGVLERQLNEAYWQDRRPIDVDVSPRVFDALVERTCQQWSKLGGSDPYWSVLTQDEYRADKLTETSLRQFYETGRQSAELLRMFGRRASVALPRGTCLELGCGVGRVTRHLAHQFDRVIAVDISAGNLAICDQYLRRQGVTNVETKLISSPHDLRKIGAIDCFYSIIVLQHNPPPIQKVLLESALSQLVTGGVFLFQTPDSMENYTFEEKDVLRQDEHVFDMHCFPKVFILRMLATLGLEIRDVICDPWTGLFGSYTYFGQRP